MSAPGYGAGADALAFYRGKRVFLTGHTGFKGAWLSRLLFFLGAEVTGYALAPEVEPSLFQLLRLDRHMQSVLGDVRDPDALKRAFKAANPEIVFHLAAQPLVRESYVRPRDTYETNVMGTVNVLENIRCSCTVRSFINVTTDKVYENREWAWGYRENEPLDGFDPYSNSKSCSELVTHSYQKSFFPDGRTAISTVRAGNVIGGGDFAADRIVPDCVRAAVADRPIVVRNPNSVRPYQHVLDPLAAYLALAARQQENGALAGGYNVGPDECDCVTTGELADLFCSAWGGGARWEARDTGGPHEANFLKLDCSKLKAALGWKPRWHIKTAVGKTVDWTRVWRDKGDIEACMSAQIHDFFTPGSTGETR